MTRYNPDIEDPIRAYPVWLARLANHVIHWTDTFCGGACGRPITGNFQVEVDNIDGLPVNVLVCAVEGECEDALSEPWFTQMYADQRPAMVLEAPLAKERGSVEIVLNFGV